MKWKKIAILVLAACLVISLVLPAQADPLTLSAVDFFLSGWATYAAAHGLDMTLTSNGSAASSSNPMSSVSIGSLGSSLWSEYNATTNDYTDIDEWLDTFQDAISYVPSLDGVNVAFTIGRTLTGWYDQFANWVLETKYNLTHTGSGYAHSSGSFDSPLVNYLSGWPVFESGSNTSQIFAIGKLYGSGTTTVYNGAVSNPSVFLYAYNNNGNYYPCTVSLEQSNFGVVTSSSFRMDCNASNTSTINGVTYYYSTLQSSTGNLYFSQSQLAPYVMIFNSYADAVTYYANNYSDGVVTQSESIQLRPQDKYNESPIPVPDTTAAGYEPDVLTGDWAIAGSQNMTLADIIDDLLARIQVNQGVLVAENSGGGGGSSGDSNDPDDYQSVGLSDVFPFCLPFDLYDFFACLAAEPVTPRFQIPFVIDGLVNYTFDLDLSSFNSVAAILRKVELLAFCVGLILITRDKMIRG